MTATEPSIATIKLVVTDYYGLNSIEMVSRRRARRYSRPRQIAMTIARDLTPCSYPEIGREFGERDHTTVMHAVKVIERLCVADTQLVADINAIRDRVLLHHQHGTV